MGTVTSKGGQVSIAPSSTVFSNGSQIRLANQPALFTSTGQIIGTQPISQAVLNQLQVWNG